MSQIRSTSTCNRRLAVPEIFSLIGNFMTPLRYLVSQFGRGGAGAVLAHVNGHWSNPAFYNFGTISVGPQTALPAARSLFC